MIGTGGGLSFGIALGGTQNPEMSAEPLMLEEELGGQNTSAGLQLFIVQLGLIMQVHGRTGRILMYAACGVGNRAKIPPCPCSAVPADSIPPTFAAPVSWAALSRQGRSA